MTREELMDLVRRAKNWIRRRLGLPIPCRCGVVRDISNAGEMEEFAMSLHTAEMCLWGG